MRRGEILNLRWNDVDFKSRMVTVRNTKSRKYRMIPMNKELTETLREIKIWGSDAGYVFAHNDGKPLGSIRTAFDNLRRKLRTEGVPHFRFHDLRHTFASHLVMSGADLVLVKELLGHSSITMTMRYSHLSEEHKRAAVEALSGHYLDTGESESEKRDSQLIDIQRVSR
jgi:integrase